MWNYKTPGIPDEYFERAEKVPITKEEVRRLNFKVQAGNVIDADPGNYWYQSLLLKQHFKLNQVVKF